MLALPSRYASVLSNSGFGEARAAIVRRANVNGDGVTNAADIDAVFANRNAAGNVWYYDFNVDGAVTNADVDVMVHQMLQTEFGDANLDQKVNFDDLLALAQRYGTSFATDWASAQQAATPRAGLKRVKDRPAELLA